MTDKPTREPDGTWVARVEYKFKQLGGHPLGCPCSLCEDARAALGTPPEPLDAVHEDAPHAWHVFSDEGVLVGCFDGQSQMLQQHRQKRPHAIKAVYLGTPPPDKPPFDAVGWLRGRTCTPRCITPRGVHPDCLTLRNVANALEAAMKEEGHGRT